LEANPARRDRRPSRRHCGGDSVDLAIEVAENIALAVLHPEIDGSSTDQGRTIAPKASPRMMSERSTYILKGESD